MNEIAPIGHNQPPEPIDLLLAIQADYDDVFAETANWADGNPVENDAQMHVVDSLVEGLKEAETQAKAAKEAEYRPHKAACDAVVARWKPFLTDLDRQKNCLLALVEGHKRKKREAQEAAEREARIEAARKMREAQEAAQQAAAGNLDAQREAAFAQWQAEQAQQQVKAASRGKVTGLRAHTEYVVQDRLQFARWIWGDKDARKAFEDWQDEYARRHKLVIPGVVEAVTERRAV